jgi:predicted nucleotidyltransferase
VLLFKFVALELSKAIGHKVDLIERTVLTQKPVVGRQILEEVKPI